jgi:hypothetical protein
LRSSGAYKSRLRALLGSTPRPCGADEDALGPFFNGLLAGAAATHGIAFRRDLELAGLFEAGTGQARSARRHGSGTLAGSRQERAEVRDFDQTRALTSAAAAAFFGAVDPRERERTTSGVEEKGSLGVESGALRSSAFRRRGGVGAITSRGATFTRETFVEKRMARRTNHRRRMTGFPTLGEFSSKPSEAVRPMWRRRARSRRFW